MKHPNAAVSVGGSSLAVGIVWVATNVLHWTMSAEDAVVVGGAITTAVLFVGRNGLRGIWRRIVDGDGGVK